MAKAIDWLYFRPSCTTCKRANGYLDQVGAKVKEQVNATKTKYGPDQALTLLEGIDKVVAMKGAKVTVFDLKKERPEDAELMAHLIGPTGNLRAPTARVGRTLLVGFNEEAYQQYVG